MARAATPAETACVLVGVASAVAFALVTPPVADLAAARARQYAAEHGVGLSYWFSWFGGTVPGHYSVLTAASSAAVGSVTIAAVSSVLVSVLGVLALRGCAHPAAAALVLAAAVFANLWSGRVAFLFGSVFALLAVLAVRARRPVPAAVAAVVSALVTPTCAAFLVVGLIAVAVFDRRRRWAAVAAMVGAGVPSLGVLLVFGAPGPEGFRPKDAILAVAAALVLLAAGLPRQLRATTALAVVVCVAVAVVPNGMGSNFQRFVWFVLAVVCVAEVRRRRWIAYAGAAFALVLAYNVTVHDLIAASHRAASPASFAALNRYLDTRPDLVGYRVEAVEDGTHAGAFVLLGHATLARGDETQSDKKYNLVLEDDDLDAATYRRWLDDNAVGAVVLTRHPVKGNPEDGLVRDHRPSYLRPVWSDADRVLYAVDRPVPIAAAPLRTVAAGEAYLTLTATASAIDRPVLVRVRWSRFLEASGARLQRSRNGWTLLTATRAGTITLRSTVF